MLIDVKQQYLKVIISRRQIAVSLGVPFIFRQTKDNKRSNSCEEENLVDD